MWSDLKRDILELRQHFFVDMVQAPLLNKIITLGMKYPVPTHQNVKKHNSHLLIDLFEEFEKFNTARVALFIAIKRLVIGKYEADDFYSERFDWFIRRISALIHLSEWELPLVSSPTSHWSDPVAKKELALTRMLEATKEN